MFFLRRFVLLNICMVFVFVIFCSSRKYEGSTLHFDRLIEKVTSPTTQNVILNNNDDHEPYSKEVRKSGSTL